METGQTLLHNSLGSIAETLDRSFGEDWTAPAHLVFVELVGTEGFDLGTKAVDGHPLDHIDGFVAPASWAAFGVMTHGWASVAASSDITQAPPSRQPDRQRIRVVCLVARDGSVASRLHVEGKEGRDVEPPVGAIVDGLRRSLRLPLA